MAKETSSFADSLGGILFLGFMLMVAWCSCTGLTIFGTKPPAPEKYDDSMQWDDQYRQKPY